MLPHADQYLTYTQKPKNQKQKFRGKPPNHMLFIASKIMHSSHYFCREKGN